MKFTIFIVWGHIDKHGISAKKDQLSLSITIFMPSDIASVFKEKPQEALRKNLIIFF